jgi:putative transposase
MKENFKWKTGRSCVFKNFMHLVFVIKYRRNVFSKKMIARLHDIFLETCTQMDAKLIEFGAEDDHVHLMVCCPPKLATAHLVGKLKGKSSYLLRIEF